MSNSRRPSSGKAERHLSVVPDPQPAMWDAEELKRLAALRQLAADTNAPEEALRIIGAADSADAALAALTEAGLIPSDEDSVSEMLSWFTPLLDPACDQLDAEICAAEFIGAIRRAGPGEEFVSGVLCDLIADVAGHDRGEATAMLRGLSVIGPAESRAMAAAALSQRVRAGLPDLPWAARLGSPVPGRAFGYADIFGEQRSMVITFSYGRKRHAIVVLIDYLLGGGIKDCYVVDYTDSLRAEYRKIGQDPDLQFSDLDQAQAHGLLTAALSRPPCPADAGQAEDVDEYLDVVRARVELLAGPGQTATAGNGLARTAAARTATAGNAVAGTAAGRAAAAGAAGTGKPGTSARRSQPPRNVHRIKVTLRGTKPAIWRRLEVPSDVSLTRLHEIIQAGFGWEDYHLFVFETPQGSYGIPGADSAHKNAATRKLSAVADWPGDKFRYQYDFGDNWELDILVEAVQPAEPGVAYPRCTAGKRAGPPEDCGGVFGYARLLSILASKRHQEHRATLNWLGLRSAADFDPGHFDADEVSHELSPFTKVLIKARP